MATLPLAPILGSLPQAEGERQVGYPAEAVRNGSTIHYSMRTAQRLGEGMISMRKLTV